MDLAAPLDLAAGDRLTFTIKEGADGTDNRVSGAGGLEHLLTSGGSWRGRAGAWTPPRRAPVRPPSPRAHQRLPSSQPQPMRSAPSHAPTQPTHPFILPLQSIMTSLLRTAPWETSCW